MATSILSKSLGSAYHQQGTTLTPQLAYRIPRSIWISIRSGAPSWLVGPAASGIQSADVEAERQEFVAKYGSDGVDQTND